VDGPAGRLLPAFSRRHPRRGVAIPIVAAPVRFRDGTVRRFRGEEWAAIAAERLENADSIFVGDPEQLLSVRATTRMPRRERRAVIRAIGEDPSPSGFLKRVPPWRGPHASHVPESQAVPWQVNGEATSSHGQSSYLDSPCSIRPAIRTPRPAVLGQRCLVAVDGCVVASRVQDRLFERLAAYRGWLAASEKPPSRGGEGRQRDHDEYKVDPWHVRH
jgi:hypothetical protein